MEPKCNAVLWLLLLTVLLSQGAAQHWSYGLRPGGKREAHESLQDVLENITEDMDLPAMPREPACVHFSPHFREFKGPCLRDILNILAERDTGRKNI